jgi:type I restriction enzyme M protein
VFNGSPLFTGAAGSGESEIRRWIIENDWLDAVVALPDQLFYNTGISTYFWLVTNRKAPERQGTVQLIDARECWSKMRKSLGEKRKQITDEQIAEITRLYADHTEGDEVKILPNESFGFLRVTVQRPLRVHYEVNEDTLAILQADKAIAALDEPDRTAILDTITGWAGERWDHGDKGLPTRLTGALSPLTAATAKKVQKAILGCLTVRGPDDPIVTKRGGHAEPAPDLRDQENVPLPPGPLTYEDDVTGRLATPAYQQAIDQHIEAEVHPYVPDAWADHAKTKIGYEIPLTRHFYTYVPPRPLIEIDADIKQLEAEIQDLLREVTE